MRVLKLLILLFVLSISTSNKLEEILEKAIARAAIPEDLLAWPTRSRGDSRCPRRFPNFEPHTGHANHGDVCRNKKVHKYGVGWACPYGCSSIAQKGTTGSAPYCVMKGTKTPCRKSCPSGFPKLEVHTGDANHGDVCRNKRVHKYHVGWVCPSGCSSLARYGKTGSAPYCVMKGTKNPCRTMSSSGSGSGSVSSVCPKGFPKFEDHTGEAKHGDLCRNKKVHKYGVGWACPSGCYSLAQKGTTGPEPYCLAKGYRTKKPCRARAVGSGSGYGSEEEFLADDDEEFLADSEENLFPEEDENFLADSEENLFPEEEENFLADSEENLFPKEEEESFFRYRPTKG